MRRTLLTLLAGLALIVGLALWMTSGAAEGPSEGPAPRAGGSAPAAMAARDLADVAAEPQRLEHESPEDVASTAPAEPPAATGADQPPAFAFRGRVVDHLGAPIAGATVIWWPSEAASELYGLTEGMWSDLPERDALPRVLTDRSGRFEVEARHVSGQGFTGLYDDPHLVVVAQDFAIRDHACRAYSGGEYDAGDIALEPGGWLEGRVVDQAGRPIAGARVRPWNPRTRSVKGVASQDESFGLLSGVFAAVVTAPDGTFRTGGLWDGKVQVGIGADGFLDRYFDDYVPVTAGQATRMGDVVLDAGAAVAGVVLDDMGVAVPVRRSSPCPPNPSRTTEVTRRRTRSCPSSWRRRRWRACAPMRTGASSFRASHESTTPC